jgi:YidC/Oxa1 family membrane protein insertase
MLELFDLLFTNPITNILVAFYQLLSLVNAPYALALAIVLLTAVIKLLLWPFVTTQIKSMTQMQKITPHMSALKEKHKGDKIKLNEEMMKLYKEHGVNPAAGCLPLLIQMPVIFALYNALIYIVAAQSMTEINKINSILYFDFLHLKHVWDATLFTLPLAGSPMDLFSDFPIVFLVPLITGVLQFVLSKMMMPEVPIKTNKDDFQTAFQTQSLYIFPIMIGFFSFTFPIGLSLYWNTFSLFGILQQYLLVGPGGAKPLFDKVKRVQNKQKVATVKNKK